MATDVSSKRQKEVENDNGEDTDRFSTLPDSLLSHILSFLPTRTSVATMTLVSRRWLHLWEHLQVFDFDDDMSGNQELRKIFKRFAFFVNAVLSRRRSRDIQKFRLRCSISDFYNFPGECVDMWVRAAIGPYLQELDLTIDCGFGAQLVLLPPSFFNCTNLVSLSLAGSILVKIQHSSVHFPSLKMLKIDPGIVNSIVNIDDIDIVDPLIDFLLGCPILETFDTLFDCSFLTNVPVPPSSKRLKLTDTNFSWTCLQIDADWLDVKYGKTTLGIIGNLQTVEEAYLDLFSLRESKFVDPMLKHLRDQKHDLHLLLRHSKSKEEPSPLRTWDPKPTTVSKCLESHLTCIHIEGYQGFKDELAFTEYILRHGLVLHTVLIFFYTSRDLTNKYRSLKRLTDIPRGSVTCQLKFDSTVSP